MRPYPDPRVSCTILFPIRASATFPLPPLHPDPRVSHTIPASARQVPQCPFLARQAFFTALVRVLSLPRVRYPSATTHPCPAPHVSYHPRASGLPTDPCVSYTLPHVIQVARQLIPSLSRISILIHTVTSSPSSGVRPLPCVSYFPPFLCETLLSRSARLSPLDRDPRVSCTPRSSSACRCYAGPPHPDPRVSSLPFLLPQGISPRQSGAPAHQAPCV